MAEFQLPHDHGTSSQAASLHQEVMRVAHFAAAAEVFKQLSDPTRVRIFCHCRGHSTKRPERWKS